MTDITEDVTYEYKFRIPAQPPLTEQYTSTCVNLKCMCMLIRIRSFNLNFRYMATRTGTYTRVLQCSHASVGLAQARLIIWEGQ